MSHPSGKDVVELKAHISRLRTALSKEEFETVRKEVAAHLKDSKARQNPLVNPFEGLEILCRRCGFEHAMTPEREAVQPYTHHVWEFECATCGEITCIRSPHVKEGDR